MNAPTLAIREERENINGSTCYVIDAKTERGNYTLWIDPDHGYNLAKAMIQRNPNDKYYQKTVEKNSIASFMVENIHFKKMDDVWVPVEADTKLEIQYSYGDYGITESHHKITEILFNPDHEALGSFLTDDIRNGTIVTIIGVDNIQYTWQDGKVVDKAGKVVDLRAGQADDPNKPAPSKMEAETDAAKSSEIVSLVETASSDVPTAVSGSSRVIHFPKDRSLGKVLIANPHNMSFTVNHETNPWKFAGLAQGKVEIPANTIARLEVAKEALRDLSPLSKLRPDDLQSLSLAVAENEYRRYDFDRKVLPHLGNLTGLQELGMVIDFSAKGLSNIAGLKSLKHLRLTSPRLNNSCMEVLQQLPSLESLSIEADGLTSTGLNHLAKVSSLEELEITGIDIRKIRSSGMATLGNLPNLEYLRMHTVNDSIPADYFRFLPELKSLKVLRLSHFPVPDAGLEYIAQMKNLEELNLFTTPVSDTGLAYLATIPSLKKLNIREYSGHTSNITDQGMIPIGNIHTLESLELPTTITDNGLSHLTGLNNLKILKLWNNLNYTDAALQHISHFQNLGLCPSRS